MTKKVMLSIVSSALLLVGCGGGGSSSTSDGDTVTVDPMTERNAIIIFYHYPADVCMSDEFQNDMATDTPGASDFLFRVESNDVNCGTYGKENTVTDTEGCVTLDMAGFGPEFASLETSCVLGFNIEDTSTIAQTVTAEDMAVAVELSTESIE